MDKFLANPATHVDFTTSMGNITIELYVQYAPKTCYNIAELARVGYYDNTIFHRSKYAPAADLVLYLYG